MKGKNEQKSKTVNKGFTLIELLVVVLIIGILAAIALPQYKMAVEKSIMQEAIMNLRTIASAQDRFYLTNNRYALYDEMHKLDIEIPGEIKDSSQTGLSGNRIMTKYFIYSPNFGSGGVKAVAHRVKEGVTDYPYYLCIGYNGELSCQVRNSRITAIQKKLCDKIYREHQL